MEPPDLLEQLFGPRRRRRARGRDEAVTDEAADAARQRDRREHRRQRAAAGKVRVLGRRLRGHRPIVPARGVGAGSARLSSVREWTVAGGLLETSDGVLLVRNQRRGGIEDWSTPGGVIDDGDADLLAGLTREVEEETGLRVREWSGPLYEVRAHAPDMGWHMRCEVHLAVAFDGNVRVDDPDGIVVEATFVPAAECAPLLASCAPWVGEPLAAWLRERWAPGSGVDFCYDVFGTTRADMRVVRSLA